MRPEPLRPPHAAGHVDETVRARRPAGAIARSTSAGSRRSATSGRMSRPSTRRVAALEVGQGLGAVVDADHQGAGPREDNR